MSKIAFECGTDLQNPFQVVQHENGLYDILTAVSDGIVDKEPAFRLTHEGVDAQTVMAWMANALQNEKHKVQKLMKAASQKDASGG